MARGARRPGSKLGGHVEQLTYSEMLLARGKNLDIITQIQTIDSFLPLRSDLWLISCALYVVELIDRFTAEGEENYPLFKLLLDILHELCQNYNNEAILRYFELHLVEYLGYRPQLRRCVGCGSSLAPVVNSFCASDGGVLCPRCSSQQPIVCSLSLDALKTLRFLQDGDYVAVKRLRIGPELSRELEQLMRRYMEYLMERKV